MMGTRQVRREKAGKTEKLDNETSPRDDNDASSEKSTCPQPASEVTAGTSAVHGRKNKNKCGKKHSKKKSWEKFVRTDERHVMTPFTIRAGIAAIHPIPVSRYIVLVNQATVVRVPLTR